MIRNVAQLKASRVPAQLGVCPTDPRLLQWFNEWQEDALNHGKWWGSVVQATFCTFGGVVTWPRNVADPILITACGGRTILGENVFYKYMSPVSQPNVCLACNGHGTNSGCSSCGGFYWNDEGVSPLFAKNSFAAQLKLYPRTSADVGKRVLVQGYAGGQWVRNVYNGVYTDGEYVTLALPYGISVAVFDAGSITGIQKDATAMNVLAYGFNQTTGVEEPLADWQPDETTPLYRVSRIPHLGHRNPRTGSLRTGNINALVKLEHIPVALDPDWLILQCEPAIKEGIRSRQHREHDRDEEANAAMATSLVALNHELRTHDGDRTTAWVDLGCEAFRGDLRGFQ